MTNIKYYKKIDKYLLPRKTMFALTFGRIRSSRLVGRAASRYILHLV